MILSPPLKPTTETSMRSIPSVVFFLCLTSLATAQHKWLDAPQELLPDAFHSPLRFDLADVDKDGLLDLVEVVQPPYTAVAPPVIVRLLLGSRTGRFTQRPAAFDKRDIQELAFADMDGDGDQDLMTLIKMPNSLFVGNHFAYYENDGRGA